MDKNLDVRFYEIRLRNLTRKAEHSKAVVLTKRLISIHPDSFEIHHSWGRIQIDQENYRNSELICREVLVFDPQDHYAFNTMGISLLNQGKYDQAISFLRRGLRISPDNHNLTENLAVAMIKKGDYEEAMMLCERGLKVHPQNGFIQNWLGYLYSLQGKYKEAILKFDDAIQYYPGHEMLYFYKVIALFCQNEMQEEKAKSVFETGMQVIKRKSQKIHSLVANFSSEMNRIGEELENEYLESEDRVNLERIQKGFEYVLNLLRIEGEKLEKSL